MQKNKKDRNSKASGFLLTCFLITLAFAAYYFRDTIKRNVPRISNFIRMNNFTRRPAPIAVTPQETPIEKRTLETIRQNGIAYLYHDNGAIKSERNFKDGKLEGGYKNYYENGVLKEEGTYKDDKLEGTVKRYYASGRLKSQEVYRDDALISRETFDDQ